MGLITKMIDGNKREVKRLSKLADKVIALEEDIALLTDEEMRAKTKAFQEEVQQIEDIKNRIIN